MIRQLRVRLLGGLDVEGVPAVRLGSRKGRLLFARLALARGAPVTADALVDTLWPDAMPANPGHELSVLASRLRGVLGPDRLPRTAAGYALRVDWLDLDALADLTGEAQRRLAGGGVAPARAAAGAALALARGPALPEGPDADWLAGERSVATRLVAQARLVAAEAALRAGAAWEAADQAAQALDAEPYDEAALRLLMSAQAAAGRPALALAAYGDAASRLRDEVGVDPAPETERVYLAVLRGEPPAGSVPPVPVEAARPAGQLPGRAAELAALDAALDRVRDGQAELVAIEGESGIGKTRLLEAWAAVAAARGVTLLRGAGDDLGGGLPLQPVLDALADGLRRHHPGAVSDLLGPEAALIGPLIGRFEAAAGGRVDGAEAPGSGGVPGGLLASLNAVTAAQSLLFAALGTVLARLGGSGPVALLLDDAHWADPATVAWLHYCLHRLAGTPLLLVVARRAEEGPAFRATSRLPLGPLDEEAAAEVVGRERVAELYRRSGGNPLFLVELSRAEGADLPESVRAAVGDRCDRAGPAAPTLRAAAALGSEVDLDLLAAVLGTPPGELLDHLEEGVRRHLLTERGAGFAFSHQLVREALLAGTGAGRTALLHREAARYLAGRTRSDPLDMAYHARLGGDLPLAAAALAKAAEIAAARYDHDEALRLLDEAIELDDGAELRVHRARVRLVAGRYADASADAGTALAHGAGAPGLEVAALAAYLLRDFDTALRLADDGARLATDPELRVSCLCVAGRALHAVGDLPEAERRLVEAREVSAGPMRYVADLWLAAVRNHQGDGDAALSLITAPEVVRRSRHPFTLPHRHLAAGYALALRGRPVAALAELDRLDEVAARQQTTRFAGRADNYRGWILRNLGAAEQADEYNQRAYATAVELDLAEPRAHAALDLVEGRLRAGDLDAAQTLLARLQAEEIVPHVFRWRHELRGRLIAGRLALAADAPDAAEQAAMEVLESAQRLGIRRYVAQAGLLLAEARAAGGEPVDHDRVAATLEELQTVAPLEAWWLTAHAARRLRVDGWAGLAERRVTALVAAAGPYADTLRAAADRLLR